MDNQQPNINTNILSKKPKRDYGFIYKYTSPSGKSYIGQTVQSLEERARNGKGYRKCGIFYKAIIKYGFENFRVEILEEAPIDLLDEKEKEWISFFETQTPSGYNLTNGGEGGKTRQVYQYDAETGQFMASYPSLTEAAKVNNLHDISYISDCLHNRRKASLGYCWSFEKYEKIDPVKWFSQEKRKVYAYNLDGTFFREFDSVADAARFINGNRCDIKKVISKKMKKTGGYIWTDTYSEKIESDYTGNNGAVPVKQIDPITGETIKIFGSQSEAARTLGLKRPDGISKCCQGKAKTCAGFRWEIYKGSTTTNS